MGKLVHRPSSLKNIMYLCAKALGQSPKYLCVSKSVDLKFNNFLI